MQRKRTEEHGREEKRTEEKRAEMKEREEKYLPVKDTMRIEGWVQRASPTSAPPVTILMMPAISINYL